MLLFFSCSTETEQKAAAIVDRTILPRLHTNEVTTVISDSGITRYRITSPQWDIYDKGNQPHWNFPKGIHFERFNLKLQVDANIHANYAKFLTNEQIWELKGNVRATNLSGELFQTEQLFWNKQEERIYSDSLIKITQKKYILTGIGFNSNQSMTKYTIRNTKGIIPVEEEQ